MILKLTARLFGAIAGIGLVALVFRRIDPLVAGLVLGLALGGKY